LALQVLTNLIKAHMALDKDIYKPGLVARRSFLKSL